MTGKEMKDTALKFLGYTESDGTVSGGAKLETRALTALNIVYSDLYFCIYNEGYEPLKTLNDEIKLPERVIFNVMPYGVAMYLAQSENDGDSQVLFSALYNQKRAQLTKIEDIKTEIPNVNY